MLVITPGDPRGVGPEVTAKALAKRAERGLPVDAVVVGDAAVFARHAEAHGVQVQVVEPLGEGPVEVRAIQWAVEACLEGRAAGLVTGPIHKARLAAAGFGWPGHTDYLGHLCGVERPVMAFVGGRVPVSLVTVHVPLAEVSARLTVEGVVHTLVQTSAALTAGAKLPRLVVCGLNPHAGDEGLLGREELDVVKPAVEQARSMGMQVVGPVSVEAAFRLALQGQGDAVVAMYHDQGLGPLKALTAASGSYAVNWTLGLPMIRTSVDHGTADDIVGRGIADPGSMLAAIGWAETLVKSA